MKYFLLLILLLLFTLYFYTTTDDKIDCGILEEMLYRDQYHRTDPRASPFMYVCDSLYFADNNFRVNYKDMSIEYSKRAYNIVKDRPISDFVDINYSDSIISLMLEKDKELNLELIDIIERYDVNLLYNSKCFKKALIIFVHTPIELRAKVNMVINNHRNAIPDPTYNHIMKTYFNSDFKNIENIERIID